MNRSGSVAAQCYFRDPERFDYTPGLGITAIVDGATILVGNRALLGEKGVDTPTSSAPDHDSASAVFVARDGQLLGTIMIADTVRPEARAAITSLREMGVKTILLTGGRSNRRPGSTRRWHRRDRRRVAPAGQAGARQRSRQQRRCCRDGWWRDQ